MSKYATPNQKKYLWSFEIRFGIEGRTKESTDWWQVKIPKQDAIDLIGLCKQWEEKQSDDLTEKITAGLKKWHPDFEFRPNPQENQKTIPSREPEVKKAKLTANMDIKTALATLEPVTVGINHLEQLFKDRPIPKPKSSKVPKGYIKPKIFDDCLTTLKTGMNLLVYGPAGCGKSLMAKNLAKSLKLEFFPFSVAGGMRYHHLFGGDKIKVNDKGQQYSEFELSDLLLAVQKPSLILFDEIFGLDPEVALGLNGLIEQGTRQIQTKAGLVKVHKDCRFIGCANNNGRSVSRSYTGAMRSDASLLDRFVKQEMDYDSKVENALLKDCATAEIKTALGGGLKMLREGLKQSNIAFDASTRRLVQAIELTNAGLPPNKAFDMCFLKDLSPAERTKTGFTGDLPDLPVS